MSGTPDGELTPPPEQRPRTAPPSSPDSALRDAHTNGPAGTGAIPSPTTPTTQARKLEGWRYTFSSLSERSFLFLWLGMLVLMGGMQMQMLARGYLVYDITGSASLLGLVSAGTALPMLGLSLFGGAIADRVERRQIIQVGQGMAAVAALLVGIAIHTNVIAWYHLLAASVINGALFAFMMPARQAIIPQLVGPDQVNNAVALNAAGMSFMTVMAPALAGWTYAAFGPWNVYYIIAGLAFTAMLLTGMIPNTGHGSAKTSAPMFKDIVAGLSYVRGNPLVMVLLIMALTTSLLAMPFRSLMPVFIVDIYHLGPELGPKAMGLMVTVMGMGALAGSLFIASLRKSRRGLILIMGSFMSGVALLSVSLIPIYYVAVAFMLLLGLGDSGRRSLNQSLIMEEVDDQYRGRVMSVFMMNFGLMPLGVLPAGIIADHLGGQVAIGIMAVLLLGTTTAILVTQRRLRQLP